MKVVTNVNRIHIIKVNAFSTITTYCGMIGYRDRVVKTEFTTVKGDRFEAVTSKSATCKRCLKALK